MFTESAAIPSSELCRGLEHYSTRTLRSRPPGTIRLDSGDPDASPPDAVKDAIGQALATGLSHYGDPLGDAELRAAIARRMQRRHSTTRIGPDQVLVTHGANAALAAAMAATLNPGDGVIVADPCYSIFPDVVRMVGARPILVPHSPRLQLDIDRIATAAPLAKAMIICNPCSPTGAVYERGDLEAIVAISVRHGLVLFSDEVYGDIVFGQSGYTSLLDIPGAGSRLVYIQSFSKTYAMTGYRIGYLTAPPSLFSACARLHRTMNGCISPAIQRGALAALSVDHAWCADRVREYARRRDLTLDRLGAIPDIAPIRPNAGLFLWMRYPYAIKSIALMETALKHGVAVRPGSEFGPGGERHLAVSFSIGGDALETGLTRLAAVLRHLCVQAHETRCT